MIKVIIIILILLLIIVRNAIIVPEKTNYIIERLGKYKGTWGPGLHVKVPFIDRIIRRVNMKENVADFAPQNVITKENVSMKIDSVIYFYVHDPVKFTYGVENPILAMENLTATSLRNIVGGLSLDETLTSREKVNADMLEIVDLATDPWGIKVTRVEIKDINPPQDIQAAMEKEMRAEREKRSSVLMAQAKKESAILVATGEKESALLKAEGQKIATILAAEAQREKQINEAQGRAEAIRLIQEAEAAAIKKLNESKPTQQVLQLKSFEAFAKVADGKSTKLIIPSNLQNQIGTFSAIAESLKDIDMGGITLNNNENENTPFDSMMDAVEDITEKEEVEKGISIPEITIEEE